MFQARGLQITKNLRLVLGRKRLGRLEFHNELVLDQEIRHIVADQRTILIINLDWMLLSRTEARFPQSVRQSILLS